jgi:2-succinyl-5-enolpyruvyl-6-hydroxy-3-cyclohexene-1-carboxylate synthase
VLLDEFSAGNRGEEGVDLLLATAEGIAHAGGLMAEL